MLLGEGLFVWKQEGKKGLRREGRRKKDRKTTDRDRDRERVRERERRVISNLKFFGNRKCYRK